MSVRVVTDSTADLPAEVVAALNITVVPLNVLFGDETYRDGIDMTADEFYRRLLAGSILPRTTQPTPALFLDAYQRLAEETDEIVSIHVSPKLSGTMNSAELARSMMTQGPRIEIIDTKTTTTAQGLTVIAAARAAAAAGASLDDVVAVARDALERVRLLGILDTLEYLHKGGRIGRAQVFLGSLLNFKPMVTIEEGEVTPVQRVRTLARAVERLSEFVAGVERIEEMAVIYSSDRERAVSFAERVRGRCPADRFHLAQMGPVIGTYAGPGLLGVALLPAK